MLGWLFKRIDLKQNVEDLSRRVDEEFISPGYAGKVVNEYHKDLEKLQEEIDSLPPGKTRIVGKRKLAIGFISLIIIIGAVFLSLELLPSDDDDTVSNENFANEYLTGQANHVGNGLQPAIFDSLPASNMTGTPASDHAGIRNQTASLKGCEVEPLEWSFSETIEELMLVNKISFYADGYVYNISDNHYTIGEVTEDGIVSEWITINEPPPAYHLGIYSFCAVEYHQATSSVYFAGGMSGFDTAHREVFRCEVQPDHKLGEWVEMNSMGTGRFAHTLRAGESPNGDSYLYAMSGADSNWGFLDTVEFAPINPDGSLGKWQTTSSLNHPRPGADGFFHDGKLYMFGGGRHSLRNNTVESASVRHDGHLSNWEIVGNMNDYRSCLGVAFVPPTNKVYAIGGYTGEYGQGITDTTEVADISDLTSWKPDGNLNVVPAILSALVTPESIIVIGWSPGTNSVQYASIVMPATRAGQDDGL